MSDLIQNYNNEAQYISDTSDEYTFDKAKSSTINQKKRKYTRGKKDDEVWNDVVKGDSLGQGFYKANCKWCSLNWSRGHPQEMKVHLARICNNVPENIKIKWRENLADNISKPII
ncbi:5939_t:CDS:1 [Cetraspora pellucida]|uniref:5939_t:CDS:1 n=1 Tax=Cetraspora pellucida TaxID=1433469 RepID=A0A9N9E2A6_9GLOM|nr:5939_t:CDS:1 [Cetraspora pellucida]